MTSVSSPVACEYCGVIHDFMCPRIKSISYDEYGRIRNLEFWPPSQQSSELGIMAPSNRPISKPEDDKRPPWE